VTGADTGAVTWLPPATDSDPSVVSAGAGSPAARAGADVEASEVVASPTTATALPPAVAGAVTGAVSWLPPATASDPSVVSPAAGAPLGVASGDVVVEPVVLASPTTAMALPPAVTGAVTGAVSWLPPATDSDPSVVSPAAGAPLGAASGAVVVDPVVLASPTAATALPPAVTGALTGAVTWLPPATASEPSVVAPVPSEPDPAAVEPLSGDPAVAALLDESPRTATLCPVRVTGASTATASWLPPAKDSSPPVELEVVAVGAVGVLDASALDESPMTETALPVTVTGAVTPTVT
jgi:hypothetical protein